MANSSSGLDSQVTMTTVSHFSPTTTTVSQRPHDTLGTRILSIDLTGLEPRPVVETDDETVHSTWHDEEEPLGLDETFLAKIRDAALSDMQAIACERFDCVKVGPTEDNEDEVFQALDGLSPKHLHVSGGFSEECSFQGLSNLKHPWTELESITLVNVNALETLTDDFPKYLFSQISSLILSYCGVNFITGLENLKILRAIENSAMDSFMEIFDENPNVAKNLEILEISSTSPFDLCHQYDMEDFPIRLEQCNRLRELKLRLNTSYDTGHASSIPQSVEKLEFCGSTSSRMLSDLGNWIQMARQPTWLPQLKSICVRFDATLNEVMEGFDDQPQIRPPTVEMAELEKERDVLYQLLEAREPPVLTLK